MAQSVQHDPVTFDREQARRTALVAIAWFLLVSLAITILLLFGDAFVSLVA